MGDWWSSNCPTGARSLVEVAGPMNVPTVRGLDGSVVAERAQMSFEAAVSRIKPAVQEVIGQLRALKDEPDEVEIEFGLDLHAEAGAFVAQASADANFSVTLHLAPRRRTGTTQEGHSDG